MYIYVPCPDIRNPVGGVKVIYRYVDLLNECGFSAFVLHHKKNFRVNWFENNTKVAYIKYSKLINLQAKIQKRLKHSQTLPIAINAIYLLEAPANKIERDDFMLVPAVLANRYIRLSRGTKKAIFNQNSYLLTFSGYTIETPPSHIVYSDQDVVSTITVSEDNKSYLEYAFPGLRVFRHHWSINNNLFNYESDKKKQICFMPRKNKDHVLQVINMLRSRNLLSDFKFIAIHNKTEKEVASILKESLIFLSFGYPEGCPLPPAEAMACGCIVIGYHGMGGREYFKEKFSYPVSFGDIIQFAKTVEEVINLYRENPDALSEKAKNAATYIKEHYSSEIEKSDVMTIWNKMLNEH